MLILMQSGHIKLMTYEIQNSPYHVKFELEQV